MADADSGLAATAAFLRDPKSPAGRSSPILSPGPGPGSARPVCPISLEAIPEGAEFDLGCGTPFDVRSVLGLVLVQGAAAAHPYTRRPLGADVLRRLHAAALAHPETRAMLQGRALDGEEAFAAHLLRAAAGARSDMDQRSLARLLDTAWAGIMDRAVAQGSVAAEDLQDLLAIGATLHRSPRRLRMVRSRRSGSACLAVWFGIWFAIGATLHR
jgi:hypothetical protein